MVSLVEAMQRVEEIQKIIMVVEQWLKNDKPARFYAAQEYSYTYGHRRKDYYIVHYIPGDISERIIEWLEYHLEQASTKLHVPPSLKRIMRILAMAAAEAKVVDEIIVDDILFQQVVNLFATAEHLSFTQQG